MLATHLKGTAKSQTESDLEDEKCRNLTCHRSAASSCAQQQLALIPDPTSDPLLKVVKQMHSQIYYEAGYMYIYHLASCRCYQ